MPFYVHSGGGDYDECPCADLSIVVVVITMNALVLVPLSVAALVSAMKSCNCSTAGGKGNLAVACESSLSQMCDVQGALLSKLHDEG